MERASNGCKRHYHPASFPIAPSTENVSKYRHGAAEPPMAISFPKFDTSPIEPPRNAKAVPPMQHHNNILA